MRHLLVGTVFAMLLVAGVSDVRATGPSAGASGDYAVLDAVLDQLAAAKTPVQVSFADTSIDKVFKTLGEAAGVDIQLLNVPDQKVTFQMEKVSLKDALIKLAWTTGLTYSVFGANTVVVHEPKERVVYARAAVTGSVITAGQP